MAETVDYTTGPWSYYEDSCADCERAGTAEFIIDGPIGGYHGQFSIKADARLIAAAPELLASLTAIHEQLVAQGIKFGPLIADAEAAIAKATGADQ